MLSSVNPVLVYTTALTEAAAKMGESVTVTKDVLRVKKLFVDEDFKDTLFTLLNRGLDQLEKASALCKAFEPLESKVFPKYVTYLAKKRRLQSLGLICKEYIKALYRSENIAPVRVFTSEPLTEKQKDAIKEKMMAKLGASVIKLICEVRSDVLAGLKLEWGFVDPDTLDAPTDGVDLSLKNVLTKAALKGGVTTPF